MTFYLIASFLSVLALAWGIFRRPPVPWRQAGLSILALITLLGAALYVSHPFLPGTPIGTGEAYNYSLSTADAVSQFRAGQFPVLVGQTKYAFNGRIHPLRTAPYLAYAAGLVDLLTLHRLSFWAIQNLVLALSLLGGALSAYFCFRQVLGKSVWGPPLLALAYLFCPAVLAAAYSMDLYMTVAALPFVPLVIGANVRMLSLERPISAYVQLSAGLAAAWLAHPPVALWLTLSSGLFHLGRLLLGRISPGEVFLMVGSGILTAMLSAFVFVSTLSVTRLAHGEATGAPEAVLASISSAFKSSLLPVSASVNQLGDFQWGYLHWVMLGFCLVFSLARRNRESLLLCAVAIALLALTTPVPFVTRWFWFHAPTALIAITSQWPMQRLYLIACVWMLFAFARLQADRPPAKLISLVRDLGGIVLLGAIVWTGMQGGRFIKRGEAMRKAKEVSREDLSRAENINLTITSYSLFQPPPSFMHGVMDPAMELRLLRRGTADQLLTNWTEPLSGSIASDGLFSTAGKVGDTAVCEPRLILKPNTKYRLDWSFLIPPLTGTLRVVGDHLRREYPLPESGNARGFGMLPSNQHGMTLWSSAADGDTVHAELISGEAFADPAATTAIAHFTFSLIDETQLPMRLISLLPLRVEVTSPAPAYLETPRMYLEGYQALVAGQPARAIRSPGGLVMVPVPPGHSVVKLNYKGTFWLNAAFWGSLASWCGLFGLIAACSAAPATFHRVVDQSSLLAARLFRWRTCLLLILGMTFGATSMYYRFKYMNRAGPIRLQLVFPRGETKRSHPLLTAGRTGAGTFVYVVYDDPTHIRLGFDAWAKDAGLSDPIEVDYFADHALVISLPALYPEGHWKTRTTSPAELDRLRHRVIVKLDGQIILDQTAYPFPAKPAEITIGENRIGGSTTEPIFSGTLLKTSRAGLGSVNGAER